MEVTYKSHMGSDEFVCDMARVSFAKEASNYTRDQNEKLIKYLTSHGHWSPLAHVQITLHQKIPIFIARQFTKHTVGFVTNEVSRRYVDDEPEFFAPDVWRKRAENKKQGSSETEVVDSSLLELDHTYHGDFGDLEGEWYEYDDIIKLCLEWYNNAIAKGVAPEQARAILPQSMYTEMYTTGSLVGWARAYKLRSEEHAQKEIRDLAEMWNREISQIKEVSYSWKALTS